MNDEWLTHAGNILLPCLLKSFGKEKKGNLSVSFQHGLASLMHTNTNLCSKCSLTRQKSDSGFKGVFFVFWWRSKCDVLISLQAALLPVFLYLLYNYTRSHLIQAKCCKSSLQKWTLLCLPRNNFCLTPFSSTAKMLMCPPAATQTGFKLYFSIWYIIFALHFKPNEQLGDWAVLEAPANWSKHSRLYAAVIWLQC